MQFAQLSDTFRTPALVLRRDNRTGQRVELPMSCIDGSISQVLAATGLPLGIEPGAEPA